MKKTDESFKFKKKKLFNCKTDKSTIYTLKNEKEYSRLFINILNSNNPSQLNKKLINNNENKKNNIKKITLFNPEESKLHHNILQNNKFKKFEKYNTQVKINKEKKLKIVDSKSKINFNINKSKAFLKTEENKEKNKISKILKNSDTKNLLNNKYKIQKLKNVFEKNLTEKNIKKKHIYHKKQIQQKDGNNHIKNVQNKKDLKNNLKIKKIDILNDNNLPIEIESNKEKINTKTEKLNYIFRQNNFDLKIQTLPKLTNIVAMKDKIKNDLEKEYRSERIINESLNIIDSFTSQNISLKDDDNKNKKRTLELEYYKNLRSYPRYIYTDISQNLPKLSNNSNTELNTMNTSKLNEKQSPLKLNSALSRKLKLNTSRNNKLLQINKSGIIKIKMNKKFQINKTFNNIRKEKINFSKPTSRKIVRIKFKHFKNSYNTENNNIFNFNLDNDFGFDSEESYNNKNDYQNYSLFNNSMNKESNKMSFIKETNYRNKKHETVINNIDILGKKLLILVNNFHNEVHAIQDNTFNLKSGKLIDRIRALKKLNNI